MLRIAAARGAGRNVIQKKRFRKPGMYLEFFKLSEFPFSIACDEKYFFESEIHSEALGNMLYAVSQRKGMVLISGQVGAGKTFLSSMLASRLGLSALIVTVRHPPASGKQLLRSIAGGLGLKLDADLDIMAVAEEVQQALEQRQRRGQLVAVLIDEIQDLPDEALEEVRLIWNWELDGQRLAQIILVGQPEIRKRLLQPRWESLRQRIVLSYHLGRLSRAETADYIRHRIAVAADGDDDEARDSLPKFLPDAMEEIFKATQGTPRLINSLCDNALLTAYAKSRRDIDAGIIASVLASMTFWAAEADQEPDDAPAEAAGNQAPPQQPPAAAQAPAAAPPPQPVPPPAPAQSAQPAPPATQADAPPDPANRPEPVEEATTDAPVKPDAADAVGQAGPASGARTDDDCSLLAVLEPVTCPEPVEGTPPPAPQAAPQADSPAPPEQASPPQALPPAPQASAPQAPQAPASAGLEQATDGNDGNHGHDGLDADVLRAALLGEPTAAMARRIYRSAPPGSEAQHLAIRVMARGVLDALKDTR